MSTHKKLAYLQKKLAVARTLGDIDTEAMWQRLIDELKQRISVLSIHHTSSNPSTRNDHQPEDRTDLSKYTHQKSASA
jgi:hypothetical protein